MKILTTKFNKCPRKSSLYSKLLGVLIKKGKVTKAKNILDYVLTILAKTYKRSPAFLLCKLFLKLNVFVETKKIRVRRRTHIVPFPIKFKRRSFLVMKWLIQATFLNKKKIPFKYKLLNEIYLTFKTSSKTLKFKELNNTQAISNRSNFHFRW